MNETLLPAAPEAERAVISVILATGGRALLEMEGLSIEDFHQPENRRVFETAMALWRSGHQPDPITVAQTLGDSIPGARELIASYSTSTTGASPERAGEYADIVKEKGLARRLVFLGEHLTAEALVHNGTAVLDDIETQLLRLRPERGDGFRSLSLLSPTKVPERTKEVPTGYKALDIRLGGLGQGRLVTLASRPGIGKTTLAMNIASTVAKAGYRVGVFSLEMSVAEILERIIVAEAGVSSNKIRQLSLTTDDVFAIGKSIYRMAEWPLYVDDTAALSLYDLQGRAKKMNAEHGLDLVIVDYLQLVEPPKAENRVNEVSAITRGLKRLAKEIQAPVLALSQFSRAAEQRGGRPLLSDLRDSGSIEQDSDQVVFLWRSNEDDPASNFAITECDIGKNRHGPTGGFVLTMIKDQAKFVE